ncbi:MAG TPA: shikimate kinase [Cytophagaceae bacterium]
MRVVLTGLPGSGKSTLGKSLAARLNLTFLDTDHLITEEENRSIEKIFSQDGEAYFRNKEREVLLKVLEKEDVVIATGGGAPCFFDNMEQINKKAISIYIDPPVRAIASRLMNDKSNIRPMVAGKSAQEVLEFLEMKIKERRPYYSQAHIQLQEETIDLEGLIAKIKGAGK